MAKAVGKEMHDLASLGTFYWCKVADDRRPISSKLVLKIKYKASGELVPQGYMQLLYSCPERIHAG